MRHRLVAAAAALALAAPAAAQNELAVGFEQAQAQTSAARAAAKAAAEAVKIADKAGAGETEAPTGEIPRELLDLLTSITSRKFTLAQALHSKESPHSSAMCAADSTFSLSEDQGGQSIIPDSYNEYEYLRLKGAGMKLDWPAGISLTRSTVKIFQVKDGKQAHYRIYTRYWAEILSVVMIASVDFSNELEIWTQGDVVSMKQKHRFSANGVEDRSKECLYISR